jgi:hypothetical protein
MKSETYTFQTVPMPPNFLPLDFKIGDSVEVAKHPFKSFNGIIGTVTKLPTSTSYSNNGDKRYRVTVTDRGKSAYSVGDTMCFEPAVLQKACSPRIEGEEIGHTDVKINDIIRVEYHTLTGNYKQVSSKEGKVAKISKRENPPVDSHPANVYTFFAPSVDGGWRLNYNSKTEKIILVKAAPDPYVELLKDLKAGSVVAWEKETGRHYTYVKATNAFPSDEEGRWHVMDNGHTAHGNKVYESEVARVLGKGAEIVHKVH